jgi:hypothetical protein
VTGEGIVMDFKKPTFVLASLLSAPGSSFSSRQLENNYTEMRISHAKYFSVKRYKSLNLWSINHRFARNRGSCFLFMFEQKC